MFIAADTHLPIMLSWHGTDRDLQGRDRRARRGLPPARAPLEQRLFFADYRDVDGLKLPFRIRRAAGSRDHRGNHVRSFPHQRANRSHGDSIRPRSEFKVQSSRLPKLRLRHCNASCCSRVVALLFVVSTPTFARAQTPSGGTLVRHGRRHHGRRLPGATVTVAGIEPANKR